MCAASCAAVWRSGEPENATRSPVAYAVVPSSLHASVAGPPNLGTDFADVVPAERALDRVAERQLATGARYPARRGSAWRARRAHAGGTVRLPLHRRRWRQADRLDERAFPDAERGLYRGAGSGTACYVAITTIPRGHAEVVSRRWNPRADAVGFGARSPTPEEVRTS